MSVTVTHLDVGDWSCTLRWSTDGRLPRSGCDIELSARLRKPVSPRIRERLLRELLGAGFDGVPLPPDVVLKAELYATDEGRIAWWVQGRPRIEIGYKYSDAVPDAVVGCVRFWERRLSEAVAADQLGERMYVEAATLQGRRLAL